MDTTTARQFWIRSPGHGEIVVADLAPAQEGEVLVRARFSGVSRGTEATVFRGGVPTSQRDAMRAPFQEGDFPGPVKYGYSSVGDVLEGPDELVGREVFCLYPHQDLYRVPADAVLPLPRGLPAERAVLAANMETALNAFWDAELLDPRRILVIGLGVVGLLAAHVFSEETDAEVVGFDVDPGREEVAAVLGLEFTAESPAGVDADLVIHASGSEAGLRMALDSAAREATVLELSWYGDRQVTLPLGEAFHSRRLTLKSSQVGRVPPHRAAEWSHRRRLEKALELLLDDRLDALITGESPFEELPGVLARLTSEPAGALCHRIRYP